MIHTHAHHKKIVNRQNQNNHIETYVCFSVCSGSASGVAMAPPSGGGGPTTTSSTVQVQPQQVGGPPRRGSASKDPPPTRLKK